MLLDAAAAVDELIAEQKQPFAMHRLDAPLDFVRHAAIEEACNVLAGGRAVFGGHEQRPYVAADDVLFLDAREFFGKTVEALYSAMPVDDHDDRIHFGHDLLGEREAVDQIAGDGFGVVIGRGGAGPTVAAELFADQMQTQRFAEQPHVEDEMRGHAGEAADLRGLLRIQRNGDIGRHVAGYGREF